MIKISIMTTKKIVKNKLSKLIIVNKVESHWTVVNKWMTMAMTDAVFFICTFIYQFIRQYIIFSCICHFCESVCNCRVNILFFMSKSGFVSSYPCVIHFRGMACNQHAKINLFFLNNFQECGPQLCDYCMWWYDSTHVRYDYPSDSQVSSVKWPVMIVCCHVLSKHLVCRGIKMLSMNPLAVCLCCCLQSYLIAGKVHTQN